MSTREMTRMTALQCLSVLLITVVSGSNYDAYMERLSLRNQEAHELFRQHHPSGSYVLDYVLNSPEFRYSHPVLREYNSFEEADDETDSEEAWERLLESLTFAKDTAENLDVETATKRFQTPNTPWAAEPRWSNYTNESTSSYPYPGSEFAPQDHNWGTHRVSGGSSEVGRWINYAVYGAQAQEDDDDNEDDDDQAVLLPTDAKSGVKLDQLPAYCDPPNPCPIGYDPDTLATPCDIDIPNTKQFNRRWILQKMENGECSCDREHMRTCPSSLGQREDDFDFDRNHPVDRILANGNPYLRGQKRSDVVAKKNFGGSSKRQLPRQRSTNPYLVGNRLESIVKKAGRLPPIN